MIHTPLVSWVLTEPDRGAADRSTLPAQDADHAADGAAVEAFLRCGDLLGFQNVEFDHPLGGLELAAAEHLARLIRVAQVVGQREFVEQRAEIGALEHLEVRLGQFDLREVGDVVGAEFLREGGVVAFDFAGNHDERRPGFAGVRILDRFVHRPVGCFVGFL